MKTEIKKDGWHDLSEMPPDKTLYVMDEEGNTAYAQPTYYPFEVVKKDGDELKPWGWRGTPVFYEDGKSRWDGGWMVAAWAGTSEIGTVKYWKEIEQDEKILILTTDKHFGAQLREERKRHGLKQVEVAKKMGCTSDNISHFEKGDNTFGNGSIQTVFKYAKALGYNEINFKLK